MIYKTYYDSPVGELLLASKNNKLIGLWIEGQKHYLGKLNEDLYEKDDVEIFVKTKNWLNEYFNGKKPEIKDLDLEPIGSEFAKTVWKILCEIPYGQTTTYGAIADRISKMTNKKMSARAVGRSCWA